MWRFNALLSTGGGGGGTPTPTPTTLSFDTSGANYGLTPNESVTSGATNTVGTKASLGTVTSGNDLDGVYIYVANISRQAKFNLYLGAGAAFAIDIPVRDNNGSRVRIDYPIPAGSELFIDIATTTGAQTFKVHAVGFKSSIRATSTSLKAVGPATNTTSMGVTLSVTDTWGLIGALTAAAQGIQQINVGNANDAARTAGLMLIDIGMSTSASNTTPDNIIIPKIPVNIQGNTVWWPEMGPIDMAGLLNGNNLYAKAKLIDGTLPDPVAVQLVAKYGTPF